MADTDAWYQATRSEFLTATVDAVVGSLAQAASGEGWHVEIDQHREWRSSVAILQQRLQNRTATNLELLQEALSTPELSEFTDVVMEYNFRRRGLRIDCVLFAPGIVVILEFKRSRLGSAERDQVTNYCLNLVEFHEETRRLCEESDCVVIPILALTEGSLGSGRGSSTEFHRHPWSSVGRHPIECDARGLQDALRSALALRRSDAEVSCRAWLDSRFSPSSTILDAAISLYGHHDVSAIREHAAPAQRIHECTEEIADEILAAQRAGKNRILFVSGTPGSGKTLVGLNLAFDRRFRDDTVFVTGNAPLVDVLSEALKHSYKRAGTQAARRIATGYAREDVGHIIRNATFKIVKAHKFLGERGEHTASSDGRILVFDEAQRTYEMNRLVAGSRLADHEADLILKSLEQSYPDGAVVVALLGHNQAINSGERGAIAWLEAADRRDWEFSVSDDTLNLSELRAYETWRTHPRRRRLSVGHLTHSMRFYRNKGMEEWAHQVLTDDVESARNIAQALDDEGHSVWITRDLMAAKRWVRSRRVGEERMGLLASAQGRRLSAEGLYVEQKPKIGHWMLAPSGDIRSSNMLETVQHQYQIQGLEIDWAIVCWDADLRREKGLWAAHKISGASWQRDKYLDVAKNGYRVLLTRARKGMIVFVPRGDLSGEDVTRQREFYDETAGYLLSCGARELGAD